MTADRKGRGLPTAAFTQVICETKTLKDLNPYSAEQHLGSDGLWKIMWCSHCYAAASGMTSTHSVRTFWLIAGRKEHLFNSL
ncbi:hypothetical protein AMECASPLE_030981 [Ameca splendens]|uniref:Uncharacterized protein n=1 Tax=Ameca splendens TaxID=208324 RepID=A0ABV0Z589_9TELE